MSGFELASSGIQSLIIVLGFIYTLRAFRISNHTRNVNFIIQAEGQVDPLYAALLEEEPAYVKAVLPEIIPQSLSDEKTKGYIYTYFAYRHLSRIIYMLSSEN